MKLKIKKRNLIILALAAVLVAVLIAGAYHILKPGGIKAEKIESWPENKYTASVIPPSEGTPDYVMNNKKNGSYAIFFKDITREQSEQYINELLENGFIETAGENGAIGRTFKKDDITLNISISKSVLGIYIIK